MTIFPVITHVDQVLPSLQGRTDFVVRNDPRGYTYVDYVFAGDDTHDDPVRRECRGIKFDSKGSILARPLHKFHNVGEKHAVLDTVDLSEPHHILEKLDGTMIHPALLNGKLVLMTRAGMTEHAQKCADRFLHLDNYRRLMLRFVDCGWTPVFEYTAPDNQIVLRYERPQLTLLAVRKNDTGEYLDYWSMKDEAGHRDVPVAQAIGTSGLTIQDLIEYTRGLKDQEGFVVRFGDGRMVKIKAEDYVTKHRALDGLRSRKNVLEIVATGNTDDVLAMLPDDEAAELRTFRHKVLDEANQWCKLAGMVAGSAIDKRLDRKAFATGPVVRCAEHYGNFVRPLLFQAYSRPDDNMMNFVLAQMLKHPEKVQATWRGQGPND